MADSDTSRDDRQLPATDRRLAKAYEEGQVPHSRDVGHAMVLGVATIGLAMLGPALAADALAIVRRGMSFTPTDARVPARMAEWFAEFGWAGALALAPLLGLLTLGALAGAVAGTRVSLTLKPLTPQFSRLNPWSGLTRIFAREQVVELAKVALLAAALIGAGVAFAVDRFAEFASLAALPLGGAFAQATSTLYLGGAILVTLLVAAAVFDLPWQWYRHRANLRMTREEVKQESKESEGDPTVKGRIRSKQREFARARMMAAVPAADVVITNPTHYAVAIRYDESRMGAPRVVAKGTDAVAERIREIAREAGVPLVEAPPLARALWAHVELEDEIPVALYTAVAQVLAFVYQLRQHLAGLGARPETPTDLEVPAELDPQAGAA